MEGNDDDKVIRNRFIERPAVSHNLILNCCFAPHQARPDPFATLPGRKR